VFQDNHVDPGASSFYMFRQEKYYISNDFDHPPRRF
jgi:hypothetical protein